MDTETLSIIIGLAERYPTIATALMVIGALRLSIKPVMAVAHWLVKETPGDEDDKALEAIEASKAWRAFCWALNLFASVKIGPEKRT